MRGQLGHDGRIKLGHDGRIKSPTPWAAWPSLATGRDSATSAVDRAGTRPARALLRAGVRAATLRVRRRGGGDLALWPVMSCMPQSLGQRPAAAGTPVRHCGPPGSHARGGRPTAGPLRLRWGWGHGWAGLFSATRGLRGSLGGGELAEAPAHPPRGCSEATPLRYR